MQQQLCNAVFSIASFSGCVRWYIVNVWLWKNLGKEENCGVSGYFLLYNFIVSQKCPTFALLMGNVYLYYMSTITKQHISHLIIN